MNKRNLYIAISVLSIIGVMGYLIWGPERGKNEQMDVNAVTEEVLKEVRETKKYVEKTTAYMEKGEGESEVAFFNPPEKTEEKAEEAALKKDVVKYFIAGLLADDVDIFLSSFYPESISHDLFKSDNPDKVMVAEDIMKKITRSGQLQGVEYGERKGALNRPTNKITLLLQYKDNKMAKINIDIIPLSDSHQEEHEEAVYVITTSAWKIINQIENSTN